MRYLFVTHFFPPEELSAAFLAFEFAEALVARGHEVDVLTGFPNWPDGRPAKGYSASALATEQTGHLRVLRLPFFPSPNGAFLRRLLDFKSFEYLALWHGRKLPRPDLIYVLVPPNEDAHAARGLARHFGCPYIVNVQDIQPDSAIDLGYIKNPIAIRLLRAQERRMYEGSAHVTAIGPGIKARLVAKGLPEERISILPNWIDPSAVVPTSRNNPLRREWAIPETAFVVLYAGTFGRIHDTLRLLDAAAALAAERVIFVLVGQGYDFEKIAGGVAERNLTNVLVKPFVLRSRLSELQALSDVSVVSIRKGFGHTSVPSKVLGYMSAARPVLALVDRDCDTAAFVRSAECGLVLDPGDVTGLVHTILQVKSDTARLKQWGENGRRYVLDRLSPEAVLPQGIALLENLAVRFGVSTRA